MRRYADRRRTAFSTPNAQVGELQVIDADAVTHIRADVDFTASNRTDDSSGRVAVKT
jgi:hypothetical protein